MYLRPLINRNPMINNNNYAAGHELAALGLEPEQYDGGARPARM
jgi:hypothetical protein